jgi:hypothetical protein
MIRGVVRVGHTAIGFSFVYSLPEYLNCVGAEPTLPGRQYLVNLIEHAAHFGTRQYHEQAPGCCHRTQPLGVHPLPSAARALLSGRMRGACGKAGRS